MSMDTYEEDISSYGSKGYVCVGGSVAHHGEGVRHARGDGDWVEAWPAEECGKHHSRQREQRQHKHVRED